MTTRSVLRTSRLITQSHTKRVVAAAISSAKARNDWSNSDTADALGCCEATVRNRLDAESPNNQMTVHELLRSIQSDDAHIANEIFAEVGHKVQPLVTETAANCDRKKASSITRAGLAVSIMLEDGDISNQEIRDRRQELEAGRDAFDALLARVGPRKAEG